MVARRLPLAFAITVLIAGFIGAIVHQTHVEFFFGVKLISVAYLYVFFTVIIPAVFPKKVKAEAVFTGGAAKAPYIRPDELYTPPRATTALLGATTAIAFGVALLLVITKAYSEAILFLVGGIIVLYLLVRAVTKTSGGSVD